MSVELEVAFVCIKLGTALHVNGRLLGNVMHLQIPDSRAGVVVIKDFKMCSFVSEKMKWLRCRQWVFKWCTTEDLQYRKLIAEWHSPITLPLPSNSNWSYF